MDQRPEQPPEGKLIAAAAERMDLSIREAAKRAGISYGRWRQIVTGYQNVSPGSYAEVRAPAKTLAKMARAVGVTPEQMENEGQRPDAAEALRTQPGQAAVPRPRDTGQPVDPTVVAIARQYGINPDDPDDPQIRPVREEIAAAIMKHGAGATGEQIFHGQDASHIEAGIWDDPGSDPASKEVFIAVMRADRKRNEARRRNSARIGLPHPAASGVT